MCSACCDIDKDNGNGVEVRITDHGSTSSWVPGINYSDTISIDERVVGPGP